MEFGFGNLVASFATTSPVWPSLVALGVFGVVVAIGVVAIIRILLSIDDALDGWREQVSESDAIARKAFDPDETIDDGPDHWGF